MERRALIQWMAATGGLAVFERLSARDLVTVGEEVHRQAQQGGAPVASLGTEAARAVTVAAERIIPASVTPGATEAGVTAFIDTMLTRWHTPAERERFLAGIAELDRRSRARCRRPFADCGEGDQVALLEQLDGEVTALRRTSGAAANEHWFAILKYLTVWGYCTSEAGMRKTLRAWPPPMRYDGCASVE